MESRDFCFWLQGFFELNEASDEISAGQAALIRRHLDLVFAHASIPQMREQPIKPPVPVPAPPVTPAPDPVREIPDAPKRVEPEPPRC